MYRVALVPVLRIDGRATGYAVGEPGVDMANMFLDNHLPSFMESAGHFYLAGITGLCLLFGFRAENSGLLFTRIDRLWIRPVVDATRRLFTSIGFRRIGERDNR